MFTGIIQGRGTVTAIDHTATHATLTIDTPLPAKIHSRIGDSLAVNGVCLTVTQLQATGFTTTLMPETSRRTALAQLKVGTGVNLEPALRADARLDGHFVLGHVDTTTTLVQRRRDENAVVLTFALPAAYRGELVEKGSVALDGVSLTLTAVTATTFSVSLIPHTLAQTGLGQLQTGDLVNLETDILGKYLTKLEAMRHDDSDATN
ncbi:riboflavin synthase [Levilactobacillus acidifarinae]|uniref:Riboflavin synthase n=1 Tax=Levilactobacillus acidifarinae DSM 19394 = JCM 15949 TaxID=1423715 RepID=A0A0R1LTA9_9LACO|nr:riboflavin synthase [Levilactobacillus acidifarinae]KRK96057.1 riboflavin synthase subunit alpha [Levilactobacillus acidifarinae DSM 19394]GEO69669.1 riboflavin synthase subunit alpha [Levilactobacillus acidifarinae]